MKKTVFSFVMIGLFMTQTVMAQGKKREQYPLVVQGDLPLYPAVAKTAHVSGRVQVRVTVKEGEVVSTEVTSGNPLLASAAAANIKTWKFDKTTNAAFTTTFEYALEKEEVPKPSNPKIELKLPTLVKVTARPTKRPCHDCGSDAGKTD